MFNISQTNINDVKRVNDINLIDEEMNINNIKFCSLSLIVPTLIKNCKNSLFNIISHHGSKKEFDKFNTRKNLKDKYTTPIFLIPTKKWILIDYKDDTADYNTKLTNIISDSSNVLFQKLMQSYLSLYNSKTDEFIKRKQEYKNNNNTFGLDDVIDKEYNDVIEKYELKKGMFNINLNTAFKEIQEREEIKINENRRVVDDILYEDEQNKELYVQDNSFYNPSQVYYLMMLVKFTETQYGIMVYDSYNDKKNADQCATELSKRYFYCDIVLGQTNKWHYLNSSLTKESKYSNNLLDRLIKENDVNYTNKNENTLKELRDQEPL